jgi:hypothetical protein
MDRSVPRVIHLVREANGVEPFRQFLASYARHPAGTEHELILLFKGFASPAATEEYVDLARESAARCIHVDDRGFDLNAYLEAARRLAPGVLCFINSYSRILHDGWLSTLHDAMNAPDVGMAGATGSWGSLRSYVRFDLGLRGPYATAFPDRAWARRRFREHTRQGTEGDDRTPHSHSRRSGIARRVRTAGALVDRCIGFGAFPAVHVRSNCFLIDRDRFLSLQTGRIDRKIHAYRLESGAHSITTQVRAQGLRTVLAGADGRIYEPDDWPASETFWQGDQRNLLVADNQTDDYERGSPDWRTVLSRYAWGAAAAPSPPDPLTNTQV